MAEQVELRPAQDAEKGGLTGLLDRQRKAIVGSWLLTVNNTDGPVQKGLITFIEDGNLVGTSQGDIIPAHLITTAQHGTWTYQGGRTFTFTFLQVGYDPDGGLVGILKVQAQLTLNESGDGLSGRFGFQLTDPSGKVVASAADAGTLQGTRIKDEPLR